jgi:hypothetical protein
MVLMFINRNLRERPEKALRFLVWMNGIMILVLILEAGKSKC